MAQSSTPGPLQVPGLTDSLKLSQSEKSAGLALEAPPRDRRCLHFNSCRHVCICGLYALGLNFASAIEAMMIAMALFIAFMAVGAALVVPYFGWWDRAELTLHLGREALVFVGMALSLFVPGLAAGIVRNVDDSDGWELQLLPTLCGFVYAERLHTLVCCFPNQATFRSQGLGTHVDHDSCLPTGEECLDLCCGCCPEGCERCCPRTGGFDNETPMPSTINSPITSPHATPAPSPSQTRQHRRIHLLPNVENSPGGARRSQSFRRQRYKAVSLMPTRYPSTMYADMLNQVLSFDVNGQRMATATGNGAVFFWDLTTHDCVATCNAPCIKVAFSPDGSMLATACLGTTGGFVAVFKVENGAELFRLKTNKLRPTDNIAWSRDASHIALSGEIVRLGRPHQNVSVFAVESRTKVQEFPCGLATTAAALAWSPHRKDQLAFGTHGFSVRVVQVSTGTQLCELIGCRGHVWSIAWSPVSENTLATGSGDGTVRVFDTSTGDVQQEVKGFRLNVWHVVWSQEHPNFIATLDGTIRIFDVKSGEQHFEIPCASLSTSMVLAWTKEAGTDVIVSAEANGVRLIYLQKFRGRSGLSSFGPGSSLAPSEPGTPRLGSSAARSGEGSSAQLIQAEPEPQTLPPTAAELGWQPQSPSSTGGGPVPHATTPPRLATPPATRDSPRLQGSPGAQRWPHNAQRTAAESPKLPGSPGPHQHVISITDSPALARAMAAMAAAEQMHDSRTVGSSRTNSRTTSRAPSSNPSQTVSRHESFDNARARAGDYGPSYSEHSSMSNGHFDDDEEEDEEDEEDDGSSIGTLEDGGVLEAGIDSDEEQLNINQDASVSYV